MKKNDEKYTWDKDKIECYPTISFSKFVVGFFRLIVFLQFTFFCVFIYLFFKAFFKPLKLYSPIFFIRKLWSLLILGLFGLKLKVVGKQSNNSKIFGSFICLSLNQLASLNFLLRATRNIKVTPEAHR